MAARNYREVYISTILKIGREKREGGYEISRSNLANLTLEQLRILAQKLQD